MRDCEMEVWERGGEADDESERGDRGYSWRGHCN